MTQLIKHRRLPAVLRPNTVFIPAKPRVVNSKCIVGHKLDRAYPPHLNCDACWTAFFLERGDVYSLVNKIYAQLGIEPVIKAYGVKFAKQYLRVKGVPSA